MLALGIALTTAMFTIADTLLLRPVPFRSPERLAQLFMGNARGGRLAVAPAVLRAWRSSPAFEAVESATTGTAVIDTPAGPIARASATATAGLFEMLDVRPVRGRLFDADDGRAGADDRVLLSADVWRSAFGADPALVGRSIVIDGRPALVVGILPGDFRFPNWDTVVWRPIDFDARPSDRAAGRPIAFVRFAAGIPRPDALRLATEAAHGADGSTSSLRAVPRPLAGLGLDPYYQRAVPLLFGGVGLVFLVLCANVSSLLLVRLTERRREFSMCSALGASRGRLLRQALAESAMLGVVGSVAGLVLSWILVAAARGFLPEAFLLRTLNPLNLDLRALVAASASGLLATLAAGVLPAWIGTRLNPSDALRLADRSGSETRAARSIARGLIVSEIALACALLLGAALLVRSFVNLARTDRGLDSRGVAIATISLPATAFKDRPSRVVMTSRIEDEMRRLPGVQQVALSFGLPPDGGAIHFGGGWQSDAPGAPALNMEVESYEVGSDFFDLYRIPILRGRTFQPGDTGRDIIVGERLAARLWPGLDPLGRSFTYSEERLQVVGVAREINHPSIDPRVDRPEFYRPLAEGRRGSSYFMMSLRCGDACPEGALVRRRLLAISPMVQVHNVGPLDDVYFEQLAPPRAAAALGFVFATVAVIAAAGGLFGVLSYAVGRRRREFGIRTALGASRRQIRGLVLRDGLRVGAIGVGLGSGAGWLLARGLASLQYGVTVTDPFSWAIVTGLLATTTLAAAWRPARQAARVDPAALLRDE
jgi:predicted permease